jgi:hypothetical protein
MITPDTAAKWRSGPRFDQMAAALIGAIAVLAAILAVIHTNYSLASTRAQLEGSRLAADIAARISTASLAGDLGTYGSDEAVLRLEMQGTDRAIAAGQAGEPGAAAIGEAEYQASKALRAALDETQKTIGGTPLDVYAADLVTTTNEHFQAEVTEQNHQVDVAKDAGSRDRTSILGLSFLALAGVLAGLAAVLREGRAGRIALLAASGIVGWAMILSVLAVI